MKRSYIAFTLTILLLAPSVIYAQTRQQQNAAASNAVRARFNPNVEVQSSGSTFQGIRFSGIGGAIAGCANVGGLINSGLNSLFDLFKKKPDVSKIAKNFNFATGKSVPVDDSKTQKQLKQSNQITQCLNGVAYAVAHNVLQQVTNKTISWVNTGLNGNPLYIKDIDSYLRSVRDAKVGEYVNRIQTKDPVFGNALRSVITQQVTGKSDGLINKVMDTPEGRAYEDFQKDFRNGGWAAFLNPQNNPIGAALEAGDELARNINTAQQNIKDELQRNGGYLDYKKCSEWAGPDDDPNPDGSPKCLHYEVVTPGSVIQAQVNEVTTSPIRQLEQADQINEVLGAFFDQLMNRLFTKGLSNLGNKRLGSGVGIGSNVVVGQNGQPLSGLDLYAAQDALGYQTSGSGNIQDFDISHPQQLRAIVQTQADYLNSARDARAAMNRIVPTLGALDYCFPGPNPTWATGLDENYLNFYNGLETPDKNRSAFHNFLTSLPIIGSLFGGGSNTIDNALIGQPILTDKVTDGQVTLDPIEFVSTRKQATHADFKVYFDASYGQLLDLYKTKFKTETISNAFASLGTSQADQDYARGFVTNTLKETKNLVAYERAISEYDNNYEENISNAEDALQELNSIKAEVDDIVATAKARYVREQAALGTPVDISCLDSVYQIDNSPVVGLTRLESDTPSALLQQSIEASDYFYKNL